MVFTSAEVDNKAFQSDTNFIRYKTEALTIDTLMQYTKHS